MGWSPLDDKTASSDAVIGDEPFDLISDCFAAIGRLYARDWERKPSLRELIGTVQSVLEAKLQDHTSDGQTAELIAITCKTKKIAKRQKFSKGDIVKAEAADGRPVYGRIFYPMLAPQWGDPDGFGPFVGVYDSIGMEGSDLDAICVRTLIVKAFPIHREILQNRGWLVIGNRPLLELDRQVPVGPLRISGSNQQLEAANFYYGIGAATFYNIECCLIRPAIVTDSTKPEQA